MRRGKGLAAHYKPIADYGIIGDLETAALVGMDGSIDFMCFPRFDSPTMFAALLDYRKGGKFLLAPQMDGAKLKQIYMPDSNALITRFLSESGMAEVSDFMPVTQLGHAHALVRRAKSIRGDITFRIVCDPRFDYGRAEHRVEKRKGEVRFISKGSDRTVLRLRTEVPVKLENWAAVAEFRLASGQNAAFVLEDGRENSRSANAHYVPEAFKETINFWRNWIHRCNYRGRWREMV